MKVEEIIKVVLLLIIALELGYVALQLRPSIGPRWPAVSEEGILQGEIPKPSEAQLISEKLDYISCGVKLMLETSTKKQQ